MKPTRITVEEAKEKMDRGEPLLFIDSRNSEAWAKASAKLPGAVLIPPDEVQNHLREMTPGPTMVTYCTCPQEASSFQVAQRLLNHGFKKVHALYDGFDAWVKAGYPVEPKDSRSRQGTGNNGTILSA
ncbi:MAG TPA: rhodanese-like domain-containing protein [Blastocatellia bacterium]|nr:rhodanese-like domain-containing protein [Blastocatellia bacterium]